MNWVVPLVAAAGVGMIGVPLARRLALNSGLVDRPGPNKSHRRAKPYLGGVAIAVAVLIGYAAGRGSDRGATVIGVGSVLVVLGLLDDDRTVPPLLRVVVETGCAIAVLAAGVRLHGTGVAGLDIAVTVLLLVAMANSVNLLDNLDGLAAGVTAAGAAGTLAMAAILGHGVDVTTSAALLGACLAFLVFNAPPASIFMGDAGSLFLGFVLAAITIRVGAALPEPASAAFPALVLGLPFADTVTVVLGRLRHGRSPIQGGRDHLSHRLARLGLGRGRAVALLVAVEAVLAALAVLGADNKIPLGPAVLAGVVLLVVLVVVAGRARVYDTKAIGLPHWLTFGGIGLVLVVVGLAVPSLLGAIKARPQALAGEAAAQAALNAAEAGHLRQAGTEFALAKVDFSRALADLDGPLTSVGLAYPVLSTNLATSRTIAGIGVRLATVGTQIALASDRLRYGVRGGTVPVASLASTAPELDAALSVVESATRQLATVPDQYLLGQVRDALSRLDVELAPARTRLEEAASVATYLPPLLGLDGPRRYFLAMQDDAESRATGGLIGLFGVLVADKGHLRLVQLAPIGRLNTGGSRHRVLRAPADYLARYGAFDPADNWQMVNMSPDFPTVASVIASLYPQSGGGAVDGVIGVDPTGLASLLELTGPLHVAGWPVPIDSRNVVPVTELDSYVRYASSDRARQSFLADLVRTVFAALSNLRAADPATLVDDLAPAVRERHIQVYSTRPAEQAYLGSLGMTGAMPPVVSDSLELTTQNASGNKIDWFLRRSLDYQVLLDPVANGSGSPATATVTGQLTVTLDNTAPASGFPVEVIGPYEPGFVAGENRTFVTVYTPLDFTAATLDGRTAGLESSIELGQNADSTFLDIAAHSSAVLHMSLQGEVALRPGGWYQLDLPSQPLLRPDRVTVSIDLPPGWRVSGVEGAQRLGATSVGATFALSSGHEILVRVARAA